MPRRRHPEPKDWVRPPLPDWPGLLSPVIAHAFAELDVCVSVWISGPWWHPIHVSPNVTGFEYERGVAARRWEYNGRCLGRAQSDRRSIVGEHAGFHDLFVPVERDGSVGGILVAGPFAIARPTTGDVLRRWYELTGEHGRLSDTSFSRYLTMTLGTLTLEGRLASSFERLLHCFAGLLVGRKDAQALAAQAESMRSVLANARLADRMWETTRKLVDERTAATSVPLDHGEMARLGVARLPEHAVVGLLSARQQSEPIDERLRMDLCLRACVELARKRGDCLCGPVGDHGVVFVVDRARTRGRLADLAHRAADVARKHGFGLNVGICPAGESRPLAARYVAALSAAEKALSSKTAVVYGEPLPERAAERLRELRRELGDCVRQGRELLAPRFERYVEAVLAHTGFRLEPTRSHLEAGLERLVEPLRAGGIVSDKGSAELWSSAERASESARTVTELVASFRAIVSGVASALESPAVARREDGVERALRFMRESVTDTLTLDAVAKVAGFAPDHFSRLFKRSEGVTFASYLRDMRLARAKEMLTTTNLTVEQIQRLSGFQTRTHFHRAFRQNVGATPSEYRERGA